jgi:hypothetical protein
VFKFEKCSNLKIIYIQKIFIFERFSNSKNIQILEKSKNVQSQKMLSSKNVQILKIFRFKKFKLNMFKNLKKSNIFENPTTRNKKKASGKPKTK